MRLKGYDNHKFLCIENTIKAMDAHFRLNPTI